MACQHFKNILKAGSLVTIAATAPAFAEPAALSFSEDWTYQLTAFAFLPISTTGTSTIAGSSAAVDLSLKDVFDILDFAISGRFEAWKGDFGFVADANYTALSDSISIVGPLAFDVDVKQSWLGLLGAYRVASGTRGAGNLKYSWDVQAGARYNTLKQEIAISGGPGPGIQLGGTENWWEPVVGARGIWELSDTWAMSVMADAGGFGVGGDDLQWSATLQADYSRWQNTSITFGWRYYSIDFSTTRSDGVFAYDVQMTGPFIGIAYTFN